MQQKPGTEQKICVDFHSHILPGVDDGSQSVEESIALLRASAEQGIRHMVATPHFYAHQDTPDRFLAGRAASWQRLQQAMAAESGLPRVTLGAEVYYFSGISECDALPRLTIGNGSYLLLEMPQAPWTPTMYRELAAISEKQNLTPIVAHVDRYVCPLRTRGIPERLAELPVLVQANAEFFLQPSTSRMALRMLRDGTIHLLGSDCHNLTSRTPNLAQALSRIEHRLGASAIEEICQYERQIFSEINP